MERVARVARKLGLLCDRMVFIGGAVAPLLHTDPVMPSPRATEDVDAVVETLTYAAHGELQDALRALGFKEEMHAGRHAHRWRAPTSELVDLVPVGDHLGTMGQIWDFIALERFERIDIEHGVSIRYVSAPVFLAMKFAAYNDRGIHEPLYSHDLEDILALIACRPSIVGEVTDGDARARHFVAEQSRALLALPYFDDVTDAHLNNAFNRQAASRAVCDRLRRLADAIALG